MKKEFLLYGGGLLLWLAAGLAGSTPALRDASILVEQGAAAISGGETLRESIGIETIGGVFTPLLAKGCRMPCALSQEFSTAEDGQSQILLHLYRGNTSRVESAHFLGTFQITGIAPMRRGEPRIRIEFKADAKGIHLLAKDHDGKFRLSLARVGG